MRSVVSVIVLAVMVLAGTSPLPAQPRDITPQPSRPASPGAVTSAAATPGTFYADAWAVIIGINEYQHPRVPKLRYAVNDARSLERTLLDIGFRRERLTTLIDTRATKAQIETVLGDELRQKVRSNERVLVFFAGHGKTESRRSGDEEGYLIPVDGDPDRLFSSAISMSSLRQIADRLPARQILYVVDACYSGYAIYNRAIADSMLDEIVRKPAIQILTAGRQGDQAQERDGHGVFTQVLLRGITGDAFASKDWLSLEELGIWVKQRVWAESETRQLPQFGNLSGEGQFVFLRPHTTLAAVTPGPGRLAVRVEPAAQVGSLALVSTVPAVEVWLGELRLGETSPGAALVVDNVAAGTHRVRASKAGHKVWEREVRVAANQRASVMIDIEPLRAETARVVKGEDGAEMVLIPAGEFWMGSDDGDEKARPRHRVVLDTYYIDKHEVSNGQFKTFVEGKRGVGQPKFWTDSKWNDARQPVVGVGWNEADAYCRFVGKRLPTEAEWEKAARGASGVRYPWGDTWDAMRANSDHSNVGRTVAVGTFPAGASPYGVLDMAGNAAEWVADWYAKDYYRRSPEKNPTGPTAGEHRVIRGGSFDNKGKDLQSAIRRSDTPDERGHKIGFRCAKDAAP